VLAPLLVGFAAYGHPLLEGVFADSLSKGTVDLLYDIGLLLGAMAIPTALLFITTPVTLALGLSKRFLTVGFASVLIHAAIVIPASGLGPRAVAGGHLASSVVMTALLMAATFGRPWARVAARALASSLPAFGLASVFVLLRLPLGSDMGVVEALTFGIISTLVYAALVALLWPRVGAAFVDLVRRPRPGS
jgi:hypothetical protein